MLATPRATHPLAPGKPWWLGIALLLLACLAATLGCSSGGSNGNAQAPAITAFQPSSGPVGAQVQIQGVNFTGDPIQVQFGGVAAQLVEVSAGTQITATVPPGAQTGVIKVITPQGSCLSATPFTVQPAPPGPAPALASFSPASGPAGTVVEILGTGFDGVTGVTFGGVAATSVNPTSSTRILATVPAGASTGSIQVVTPAGQASTSGSFALLVPSPTSVAPVVTGFSTPSGAVGSQVTLFGTGFSGAIQVHFNGLPGVDPQVVSDSVVRVTVPPGAGTGPITVVTPAGLGSSAAVFTPGVPVGFGAITGFLPTAGVPGSTVTLTGSGFTPASQVLFGGVGTTAIMVDSDTQITATVPAAAISGPLTVVVPAGELVSADSFTVQPTTLPGGGPPIPPSVALPTITGISPASGPVGSSVIVTGTGFLSARQVAFGTVAAKFSVASDTSLTAEVPAAAVTGPVTVVNPAGGVNSATNFTVTPPPPPPSVTGFSPGSDAPGATVTVTGTGFGGALEVLFNHAAAVPASVSADGTSLTVVVPVTATSGPIAVTTPAGTGTSVAAFTVPPRAFAISGLAPGSGPVGTVVVITGTGLGQTSAVTFGGVAASSFAASADDLRLTVSVPVGTSTGPVQVSYPGGSVPAGSFTVTTSGSAPAIVAFSPATGMPGTQVTLTGSGFASVLRVAYNGTLLASNRFDVDSDTQIRVRIPDDAVAAGPIRVETAAAGADTATNFTVIPSRGQGYGQEVIIQGPDFLGHYVADSPVAARSQVYQPQLNLPQAPVFHAYNPLTVPPGLVEEPEFSLNIKLPPAFLEAVPDAIRTSIPFGALDLTQLDLFVVSHNLAYDGITPGNGVYEFKPQYWMWPGLPRSGAPTVSANVEVGIFAANPAFQLGGHAVGDFFLQPGLSVHQIGSGFDSTQMIVSPDVLQLTGLNLTANQCLWSLVRANGRSALTLHLFLTQATQNALNALLPGKTNLDTLIVALLGDPNFALDPAFQPLWALGRPIVHQVTRTPDPVHGVDRVTLVGTEMGAVNAVVDSSGTAIPVTPLSQTMLQFAVAPGTAAVSLMPGVAGGFTAVAPVLVPIP